jgi:hypothetical protein
MLLHETRPHARHTLCITSDQHRCKRHFGNRTYRTPISAWKLLQSAATLSVGQANHQTNPLNKTDDDDHPPTPTAQAVMHAPLTACICRAPVGRFAERKPQLVTYRFDALLPDAGCVCPVRTSKTVATRDYRIACFLRGCAVLTS